MYQIICWIDNTVLWLSLNRWDCEAFLYPQVKAIPLTSGRSHWGGKGGWVPPLTAKKLPKIWKNQEKSGKNREKSRKKEEKSGRKDKIGKFLSLCPSWQIELATLLPLMCTHTNRCMRHAYDTQDALLHLHCIQRRTYFSISIHDVSRPANLVMIIL